MLTVKQLPFGVDRATRDPRVVYDLIMTQAVEVDDDVDADAHDLLYMVSKFKSCSVSRD